MVVSARPANVDKVGRFPSPIAGKHSVGMRALVSDLLKRTITFTILYRLCSDLDDEMPSSKRTLISMTIQS